METVVGVEESDEGKFEESGIEKTSSESSSPKQIPDPVVYKLVRVEGDGRLVPATDEEIMEVEDLLEDDKCEMRIVADTGQIVGCILNEGNCCGKRELESPEGVTQSENTRADAENLTAHLEYLEDTPQDVKEEERHCYAFDSPEQSSAFMNVDSNCPNHNDKLVGIDEMLQAEVHLQDTIPASVPSLNDSHVNQCGSIGESSNHSDRQIESGSSASAVCSSSKPDFSKLRGEICLDNLSIRELHETFKATFGRETTVKDKVWLKKRIAMGLTNSCDVSTTTFVIKDNHVVKLVNEESCKHEEGTFTEDKVGGAVTGNCKGSPISHGSKMDNHPMVSGKRIKTHSIEYDGGSENLNTEKTAAKRVRKPTRRYIEELSEVELRECGGRLITSTKNSGHSQMSPKSHVRPVRNISLDGRTIVTRMDSLGGSGVQVPCVSRVRRSRPRKNIMALMKFHPSGMGLAAELVNRTLGVCSSQPDDQTGRAVLKARSATERIQQSSFTDSEKDKQRPVMGMIELEHNVELKPRDSSGDTSDDNVVTVPTAKGGMRRKHHRAWTLGEVMKLIEGVSRYGAGRWSEIKRLAFASYSYRTSVDLKDKWRNLLKASFAQTPQDKEINSRKHASIPIPAPILLRVRELAEIHAQVPPNLSSSKLAGRSVHETRSGFL